MKTKQNNKSLFIYNPHAGQKRNFMGAGNDISLEDIKSLLNQYQIPVDYAPTKRPGHATILAREASKDGYTSVITAGGDGTINETANGLVGTDTALGIIPMGTFMNITKMLSIPLDIEKAVMVLKMNRIRKIDVGEVKKLEGEKLSEPFYFLESSGIGLDAHIQKLFKDIEKGKILSAVHFLKKFITFSFGITEITTDQTVITCKSSLINIANGPYAGANLKIAPNAKLNDHMLTISIYPLSRLDIIKYFMKLKIENKTDLRKFRTLQSKEVKIKTESMEMYVHIDASMFGYAPVNYIIRPNVLNVICGFPSDPKDLSMKSRTVLSA